MAENDTAHAHDELAFCQAVLAKGGQTLLTEVFRDADTVSVWEHYPQGDVYDPQSGAQWYYHSHDIAGSDAVPAPAEHGHFHCFARPDGADGPIHHLIAIGVDAYGKPLRLFTVNQWVVGDAWLAAEPTIALLARFDVHMPRPSYLVNRWLTAMVVAYEREIADLIRQRDRVLADHQPDAGVMARDDKSLEVTSELRLDRD